MPRLSQAQSTSFNDPTLTLTLILTLTLTLALTLTLTLTLTQASFFNDLTGAMGRYLNLPEVKAAVHADGATWVQADETGPVADHLLRDWVVDSDATVAQVALLDWTEFGPDLTCHPLTSLGST